jgi:hypothetical protein
MARSDRRSSPTPAQVRTTPIDEVYRWHNRPAIALPTGTIHARLMTEIAWDPRVIEQSAGRSARRRHKALIRYPNVA